MNIAGGTRYYAPARCSFHTHAAAVSGYGWFNLGEVRSTFALPCAVASASWVTVGDTSSSSSWDRVVHLMVHNQTFCTATSLIIVHDEDCLSMVNNGEVGLGQIFRYLDKLPTFELLQAGRTKDGGLWRLYDLSCKEVSCRIREEFVPHAWDVNPG